MSVFITELPDTCAVLVLDATKWKGIDGDPHTVN
ncbi:cupin, partial [Pseudomonas aeruginosa]